MNVFAPEIKNNAVYLLTGEEAQEIYEDYIDIYSESNGCSHFGDSGEVYTSFIRTENDVPIVYLDFDTFYTRSSPGTYEEITGPLDRTNW